jgi:hypothetical protein
VQEVIQYILEQPEIEVGWPTLMLREQERPVTDIVLVLEPTGTAPLGQGPELRGG